MFFFPLKFIQKNYPYPVFKSNSTSRGRSPDQKGAADRSRSGSLKRDSKEKQKQPAKKAKRMLKADGSNSSTATFSSPFTSKASDSVSKPADASDLLVTNSNNSVSLMYDWYELREYS